MADLFAEQFTGGAELTTEALIESCPHDYIKINSKQLTVQELQQYQDHFWIFGNFSMMNFQLIPSIVGNLKYAILEYDYKFCKHRSIERHLEKEGSECDCDSEMVGKMVSAFMYGAEKIFWMSSKQEERYLERFPFLEFKGQVLGSVFSKEDISYLEFLQGNENRSGWLVQKSDSWIKGTVDGIAWCEASEKDYDLIEKLSRVQVLTKLSSAQGFCFLPKGGDSCPRIVIEAKILGCELHINENVQMASEAWFQLGTPDTMLSHLKALPERFWNTVSQCMDITSTVGAYTTTYNCISQGYPFEESIQSLLQNFDEVVVVDAGSSDGTWERLLEIEGIRAYQHPVDFSHPRWAIHSDGDLKSKAREYVTTDWCWQMDVDEVLFPDEREKLQRLLQTIPKGFDIVSLPVVEYWGSSGKVRMDVNPWKWRVSRNKDHIIHGIPKELRLKDEDGNVFAGRGTDSCDYVHRESFDRLPHASFYDETAHEIRTKGLQGDEVSIKVYEDWINQITEMLPTVYHYSWYDIERKITSYKTHWGDFWKSMYDLDTDDTAENNVCFDKPWSEVTHDDIKVLSQRLEEEKGGHIFHQKVDWDKTVPWIEINKHGPLYDQNRS